MKEEKTLTYQLTYTIEEKEVITTSTGMQVARVTIQAPDGTHYCGEDLSPIPALNYSKQTPEKALYFAEKNAVHDMLKHMLDDEWSSDEDQTEGAC